MSAIDGAVTCNDIVIAALKKSGVIGLGQSPGGSDVLDAQNDLSDMMAQWNVKTWLVFNKLDLGFACDGRSVPYTVGPGGNYNVTPRPDRVEAAYLRILGNTSGMPVDQPLKVIESMEQWSRVALKKLIAFTKSVFLDTSSPVASLNAYPWPQGGGLYELHIILKNVFPLILPLNTDLSGLPPACRAALKFNLAQRLRQAYGKGLRPDPELNKLAKDSLSTMRYSQIQVPELIMPAILTNRGRYNIYGDITY